MKKRLTYLGLVSIFLLCATGANAAAATVEPHEWVSDDYPAALSLLDLNAGYTPSVLISEPSPVTTVSSREHGVSSEGLPLPPFWFALLVLLLGGWAVMREGMAADGIAPQERRP
ncbi:MAG: hypothetical protein ACWA5X_01020 [bacterium]